MPPALVRKTWRDDRRALIGWAVGVAAFTTSYTSFYSQFQGAAQLKQDALPQGMLEFLGIPDMLSPAGYLQATIFSLIGPLLVLMCAITLIARTIAQPEEDGGMELLLANPLSRSAFAGQRLAATGKRATVMAVTGVLAVATYMANAIGGMLDGWHWLRWMSPFHYFIGTDPLSTGWHPAALLTLVAVGTVTTLAGIILFDRRDIGV